MSDVEVLRRAAVILRKRSRKPKSVMLNALCRILTDTADKVEYEA